MAFRRNEADGLFVGDVAQHAPLYQQALMSMLWNETYYKWDGASDVDPAFAGQVDAHDLLILPDKWEYPWPAAWDLAFHAVTASLIDQQLAQDQLRFILSDRWQQPDGHIPCSEWTMSDECPPIYAWAVWRVYEQSHDLEFLQAAYPGLQRNYDYWWSHKMIGDSLFSGGSLGMDNLPRGSSGAAQADASAWMAFFARDMARIASELRDPAGSERYWVDRGTIQGAINSTLWDERTGFYYDLDTDGSFVAQKSYSGLVPLIAGVVPPERVPRLLAALHDPNEFLSPAGIRSAVPGFVDVLARHGRPGHQLELARSSLGADQLPSDRGAQRRGSEPRRGRPRSCREQRRVRLARDRPAARVLRRRHGQRPWRGRTGRLDSTRGQSDPRVVAGHADALSSGHQTCGELASGPISLKAGRVRSVSVAALTT